MSGFMGEELNWQVGRDWRHQQKLFTSYQREFNEERPHESIAMRTPASIYRCSSRRYDGQLPEMAYDNSYYTRRVNWRGEVLWAWATGADQRGVGWGMDRPA